MPTINERLVKLFTVLNYDTDNNYKILTPGIRICINQERGFLMQRTYYEKFEQPEIVTEKIEFISQQLRLKDLTRVYNNHARMQLKDE